MAWICSKCGTKNIYAQHRCGKCGKKAGGK